MRKTKIIATIGPSSSSQARINRLVASGMNVARINFSHSDHKTHKKTITMIRRAETKFKRPIAILADLAGPKIRTGIFSGRKQLKLTKGEVVTFAPEASAKKGEIPVTFKGLARDVRPGNTLLLDDGKLSVRVVRTKGERIRAKVVDGGILKEHKGINLPGIAVSACAITKKDVNDLAFALKMGVDLIGVSFVQRREDVEYARRLMQKHKKVLPLIAKIERQTALQNIDEIMAAADGVMVARGDLGVETPIESVPIAQKMIISLAHKQKKPVIVATQMLESMIEAERPTRAEVSDVANSVFDGTDVVMLSAETAVGKNPPNAVRTMGKIVEAAEASPYLPRGTYVPDDTDDTVSMSTARAACFAAEEVKANAICVFTVTGRSAMYVSKQRPNVQVIALTNSDATARRLALCFGVLPVKIRKWNTIDSMLANGIKRLKQLQLLKTRDKAVILCGTTTTPGATNMIKVLTV